MTEFTVYIEETNKGYVSFPTKEEAEEWLNDPSTRDWDLVKWNNCEVTEMNRGY